MAADYEEANKQAESIINDAVKLLTRDITIPQYRGVSTSGVKKELGKATSTRDTTSRIIDTEAARNTEATRREQIAIEASGQAVADKAVADQDRAEQVANTNKYYAQLFGLEMDPSSDYAQLATHMRKSVRPDAERKLEEVRAMQAVGPLDNPMEWLVNQIQLPSRIEDYNRTADAVNSMQQILDDSVATAAAAETYSNRAIPTITKAQSAAVAASAKAKADELKAKADQDLAKVNVDFATKKLSNDMAIANATIHTTQLELSNAQHAHAAQIQAIQIADTHANRLLKAGELLEKLQDTKALDKLLANYDTTMGKPAGTTTKSTFKMLPSAQRENIVAIAAGSIGFGPYTGLENIQRARFGPEVAPATVKFAQFLQAEASTIDKANVVATTPKELIQEKLDQILKNKVMDKVKLAYQPGNPFYELSPAEMIASGEVGAATQLAKVLEDLAKKPGPVPTNFVIESIMKEWKNPSEAGQVVAAYYKNNIKLRNSSMNTKAFGVDLIGTYVVPSQVGAGAFDLTNPAEATKYILIKAVKDRMLELRSGNISTGQFQKDFPEGVDPAIIRARRGTP